jgi:hypothetical protein
MKVRQDLHFDEVEFKKMTEFRRTMAGFSHEDLIKLMVTMLMALEPTVSILVVVL